MARALVAIFAHNEERRIARCIASLPLSSDAFEFHLLVNGTTDCTAEIARALTAKHPHFHVHDLPLGGKARTWNHFVDSIVDEPTSACMFVDGDAEVMPGALQAMVATLAEQPAANGVNAMPVAGRTQNAYRNQLIIDHGIFGALYGLQGSFVRRLKLSGIRLPLDLIGDDGLVAALAKTSLGPESAWDKERIVNCISAEFAFETTSWRAPATWQLQLNRMINYSIRRYQNMVVSDIMRSHGPDALPKNMHETYPANWHRFNIRPSHALFDWLAKRRMARR